MAAADMNQILQALQAMQTQISSVSAEVKDLKSKSRSSSPSGIKPEKTNAPQPSYSGGRGGASTRRGRGRGNPRGGRGRGAQGNGGDAAEGYSSGDESKKPKQQQEYGPSNGPKYPSQKFARPDNVNNAWATVDSISYKIWNDVVMNKDIAPEDIMAHYRKRMHYMRCMKHIFRSPKTILKGFMCVEMDDSTDATLVDKNVTTGPNAGLRYAYWKCRTTYMPKDAVKLQDEDFQVPALPEDYDPEAFEQTKAMRNSFPVFARDALNAYYKEAFEKAAYRRIPVRPSYWGQVDYSEKAPAATASRSNSLENLHEEI